MYVPARVKNKVNDPSSPAWIPPGLQVIAHEHDKGFWIGTDGHQYDTGLEIVLGCPPVSSASACVRENACWMKPWYGSALTDLPAETQFLVIHSGETYTLIFPVVDGPYRFCLGGDNAGNLKLRAHAGDPDLQVPLGHAAYVIEGDDPFRLLETASKEIATQLDELSLRNDKPIPSFIDKLGWCSYNAFYSDISHEKIVTLLANYKQSGVGPGFIILDEGWMQANPDNRLLSFEADPIKFPEGLSGFVQDLRKTAGVGEVIAWHAFAGYWRGVEDSCTNGTDIHDLPIYLEDGPGPDPAAQHDIQSEQATVGNRFYPEHVVEKAVKASRAGLMDFYDAFYESLASQGVAGTKIDAMAWIEMHGRGRGGRVAVMRDLVRSAEAAAARHLSNNVLYCSSCSNDFLLQTLAANVTRTSRDYFPDRPDSHAAHLLANAHVAFWTGEWVLPDWDMFQSGHEAGAYHAAARAISGGPVYTTDEPGRQDVELLKRLRVSGSRIPRCSSYAKPTLDSLLSDPVEHAKHLKIFNHNAAGGVLGLFSTSMNPDMHERATDRYTVSDIAGLDGQRFAIWSERDQSLSVCTRGEASSVRLGYLDFEIVTAAPIRHGFAAIGLVELMNPGGAIKEPIQQDDHAVSLKLMDGGQFVAFADREPNTVYIIRDDQRTKIDDAGIQYDPQSGRLDIAVPPATNVTLELLFIV
jgi:raffinose synthase